MTKLRVVANNRDLADLLGPEPTMTLDDMRQRDPFEPWTYADYLRIPTTPWLIGDDNRPVLIARGLWVTFGLYKSAKTYLSLEQAFCIAAGVQFNGLPTMQGRVAYVCAEGDPKRILARVVALCEKHHKDPDEVLSPDRFNLIMSPVNLIQPDGRIGVDTLLKRLDDGRGPYQAIWLDTWAKMLAAFGGNDSDAESVMPAIMGCDRIRSALGCSVVIVAHVGVSEKAQDRPKGLSDLPGAVDGGTKCVKEGDGRNALFTFSAVIQRYASDDYVFTGRMIGAQPENSTLKFLTKIERARATLDPTQARMLEIAREFGEGFSVDRWRDAVLAANLWTVKKGARKGEPPANPRQKWTDELDKLVRAGWVEIEGTMVVFNDEPHRAVEVGPGATEEFAEPASNEEQ